MVRNLFLSLRARLIFLSWVVIVTLGVILYRTVQQSLMLDIGLVSLVIILGMTGVWIGWDIFILKRINTILQATRGLIAGDPHVRTQIPYTNSEIGSLARSFDQLAQILEQRDNERMQAENEVKRHNRDLAALNIITATVTTTLELSEILDHLKKLLAEQLNIPGGVIFTYSPENTQLTLVASWGLTPDFLIEFQKFNEVMVQHQKVIEDRDLLSVQDLSKDMPLTFQRLGGARQKWLNYICTPFIAKGEIQGIVDLFIQERTAFYQDRLSLLRAIGQQVGVVIQNARLYEQVRAGREHLMILSQQVLEVQEAERRHISRELHDEIGQSLTAMKVNLQSLNPQAGFPDLESVKNENITILDRTLQQVRTLSLDLRPSLLDDLGVVAAIRWYLDRQAQRAGFAAQFYADPPQMRFNSTLETTCFRVVQEALTNVVRHAQAKNVRVELKQQENEVELVVEDDGIGFDVQAARGRGASDTSLGLIGMEERVLLVGGQIEIYSNSATGRGTEVRARFPYQASQNTPVLQAR